MTTQHHSQGPVLRSFSVSCLKGGDLGPREDQGHGRHMVATEGSLGCRTTPPPPSSDYVPAIQCRSFFPVACGQARSRELSPLVTTFLTHDMFVVAPSHLSPRKANCPVGNSVHSYLHCELMSCARDLEPGLSHPPRCEAVHLHGRQCEAAGAGCRQSGICSLWWHCVRSGVGRVQCMCTSVQLVIELERLKFLHDVIRVLLEPTPGATFGQVRIPSPSSLLFQVW